MNIDQILTRLSGVRKTSNGYEARCPAHEDTNPSLSVGFGEDERILLHCHSGCKLDAILGAMGLRMRDLFPNTEVERKAPGILEACYVYTDPEGDKLYRILRFAGKQWKAEHVDAEGKWRSGLGGRMLVPYNLASVIKTIDLRDPAHKVYVVEGEKDVESLRRIGLCATSNPFGAGKWSDQYSFYLRDGYVVILPDNDEPGHNHAEQVLHNVRQVAAHAAVVELPGLPNGGDVSDWISERRTAGLSDTGIKEGLEEIVSTGINR
ncbi:MAG: hypothetical protein ACYC2Y_01380 [Armatimonadota bacterium]